MIKNNNLINIFHGEYKILWKDFRIEKDFKKTILGCNILKIQRG